MWRIHFTDYQRPLVREHASEEEAFNTACSLRRTYLDVSIEGPDGQRYDEVAITDWCQKHGM